MNTKVQGNASTTNKLILQINVSGVNLPTVTALGHKGFEAAETGACGQTGAIAVRLVKVEHRAATEPALLPPNQSVGNRAQDSIKKQDNVTYISAPTWGLEMAPGALGDSGASAVSVAEVEFNSAFVLAPVPCPVMVKGTVRDPIPKREPVALTDVQLTVRVLQMEITLISPAARSTSRVPMVFVTCAAVLSGFTTIRTRNAVAGLRMLIVPTERHTMKPLDALPIK